MAGQTIEDKYHIEEAISEYFKAYDWNDALPEFEECVSGIWQMVYLSVNQSNRDVTDAKRLIHFLGKILNRKVDVTVIQGQLTKYNITLSNCNWHIIDHPAGYHIFALKCFGSRIHNKVANYVVAELMIAFDSYIPAIIKTMEEKKKYHDKKKLMNSIVETSALGILNELYREGVINKRYKISISVGRDQKVGISTPQRFIRSVELQELREFLVDRYGVKKCKIQSHNE